MLFYLKIGFRNLLKNYRRSIKTILTIVIGLSACLLAQGFMSNTLWGLRESLINGGLGHLQIYRQGYLAHGNEAPYQDLITGTDRVFQELDRIPGIKLFAPRLNFQGMAAAGEKSAVFMGAAGVPEAERRLNTFVTLKEGSFLSDEKPFGVMIGAGLARKLNAGLGDTVTVMAAMKGGGVNALDMEIVGIMELQVKASDDAALLANLTAAQILLDLPDSSDRLILLLNNSENLAQAEAALRKLGAEMGLEYRNWRQLAGKQYTQPKLFYDLAYLLIMTVVVLVVVLSIINTLNLSMQERIREIGTIRSLGTTRLQVGKIFLAESFLIGLIGGLAGIIAGYALAALFNALGGVPIPPPPGQARGYTALFTPDFTQALRLWLLFLVTASLAGFYPAVRAARLRIVDALRWI